jgi:predicted RNA polymerase sigma factor
VDDPLEAAPDVVDEVAEAAAELALLLRRQRHLARLGLVEDARAAYDHALELVHSNAERRLLERRLAEISGRD